MVQLKLLAISMIWCWSLWITDHQGAVADPQTLLLDTGCSANNVNATNLPIFLANINAMFGDLRSQVSDQSKHFATAQGIGDSVAYAMFQCRNYLSQADCLVCFDTASAQIRNVCSTANGARVIYDGCFLRYESDGFFNQTTAQGNGVLCGNQTPSDDGNAFSAVGLLQVLTDHQIEITTNRDFFASTKTQVASGVIYAIAQCAETVTVSGCLDCLKVGFNNLQSCLPNTDGRAFDAGCFITYSNISFSDDEQNTSNSNPKNIEGKGKKKSNIESLLPALLSFIGGLSIAAGGSCVTVNIYQKAKRRRKARRQSKEKSHSIDGNKKADGDNGTKSPSGDVVTKNPAIVTEHGACGGCSNIRTWKPHQVNECCCREVDECRSDWCTIS